MSCGRFVRSCSIVFQNRSLAGWLLFSERLIFQHCDKTSEMRLPWKEDQVRVGRRHLSHEVVHVVVVTDAAGKEVLKERQHL